MKMLRCLLVLCLIGLLNLIAVPMPSAWADDAPQWSEAEIEQLEALDQQAFAAARQGDFAQAEQAWTEMLEIMPNNAAIWSNRGNVRVSQNKIEDAIADYNQAIELAPDAADPYLNRGTAWEAQEKWQAAIDDYNRVLDINPEDAAAYNNRGNAEAGLADWQNAIADYKKAFELNSNFAFARVNYALALYQDQQTDLAIKTLRDLTRKYPNFADARAGLTAALWAEGKPGEAESNWVAVTGLDSRYKDIDWVRNVRRWPPAMVKALATFLNL